MWTARQSIIILGLTGVVAAPPSAARQSPSASSWPAASAVVSRPAMCRPDQQEQIRPLQIAGIHWGGAFYPGDGQAKRGQLLRDIAMVHGVGAKYIGSVNGRGLLHPGMKRETVRLLDGNPMVHGPMNDAAFKCSLRPRMRAAMLEAMQNCVDLGMDGLILDSWQGEGRTLCFCDSCIRFYRQCLKEHRDDPKLAAVRDVDPDTFDYGGYLRECGLDAGTPIHALPLGPALAEYRFSELIRIKRDLLESVRQYAARRGSRPFHLTANVYEMNATTFVITDLLDYLSVELPYFKSFDGYPPQGTSMALHRKGQMVGKRCVIQPGCHDTARALRSSRSIATLFRIWIAEAYASGNVFDMMPREFAGYENGQVVWLDVPVQQLLPYYHFVQSHPEIYTETTSHARTAVLYSMAAAASDMPGYEREYRAVCKLLCDSHRQFDVVLAGDGLWNVAEPSPEQLERYSAMVLIRPQQLQSETVDRVLAWKTQARRLVLCGPSGGSQPGYSRLCRAAMQSEIAPAELPCFQPYVNNRDESTRHRFQELIGPDGVLVTDAPPDVGILCRQSGDRTFIHLVNYAYDRDSDQVRPVENIQLQLLLAARRASLFSPDAEKPAKLPLRNEATGVRFVIPSLHIYSVVVLD